MAGNALSRVRLIAIIMAWVLGIFILLAVATAGIAVVTLTGQTGRDMIVRLADGRQIAGYGQLSLSGLSGNPFDRLTVERLSLTDEEGEWLVVEGATLEWTPMALLGGTVDVTTLEITRADVFRAPVRAETTPGGGVPDIGVRLARFELNALELHAALTGEAATLAATGEAEGRGARWQAGLRVDRIDEPGDRVELALALGAEIDIRADLDALPGGPLATLLQAGEQGMTARVEASGVARRGTGRVLVFVGDESGLSAQLGWHDDRLRASGSARLEAWPQFAGLAEMIGGDASLELALPLGEAGITAIQLPGMELQVSAPRLMADLARDEDGLALRVREASALVNALAPEGVSLRSLAAEGRLDFARSHDDVLFDGRAALAGLALPIGSIDAASGPVTLAGPFDALAIVTRLETRGAALEPDILASLAGGSPVLEAGMIWHNAERRLEFETARIEGAGNLVIAGGGAVSLPGERAVFSLGYEGLALERLTGLLEGPVGGRAQFSAGFDGSVEFTAEGRAPRLRRDLGERLGGEARFSLSGARDGEGGLALSLLEIESPGLVAEASADYDADGWDASGNAAWSGGAPLAALVLDGTALLAFEASDRDGLIRVRAEATAPSAGAGPVVVEDARLRLEGQGPPDDFEGAWRLTGATNTGPVDIGGQASRRGERADLSGIEGRFGAFNFTGGLQAEGSAIGGALRAVPVNGFGQAGIRFRVRDGEMQAQILAEDMVGADMVYLDRLAFDASGPVEDIAFTLEADGAYGARALANITGRLVTGENGGALTLDLEGRYGGVRITSRETARIGFGGDGLDARLALALNRGRLDITARDEAGRLSLTLDGQGIPAMMLSYPSGREPIRGQLNSSARLVRADGAWTGSLRLEGENITPPEDNMPDNGDVSLDGSLTLTLDEAGTLLSARARGAGLRAEADLRLASGPVTGPESFTASDTGLDGTASLEGEIGTLAVFRLAEGQRLSGQASMNASLRGTIGAPDLDGNFILARTRFDDPAIGISVRNLAMRARFAEDGLDITQLTAQSADGGTLTGSGRLSLAEARVSGRAEVNFADFLIIERPELTAVGGGNVMFNIEDDRVAISGETRISRAEVRPPEASRPAIQTVDVIHINAAGARDELPPLRRGPNIVMDYRIFAPGRIFVRGPQFDTEWSMDVNMTGPAEELRLVGRASLLRGRADLLGRPFEMRSGSIVFAGDPMEAALDIVAARQARDITAEIRVGGIVRRPEITLTSSPSLPQDEIASRLLFDQGAGQLSGAQAAQLAAAVASLSSGGAFDPFGALRSAVGLDQFAVSSNRAGETVVSGGRYITESVYLEVETVGSSAAATTRIEWALTQNLTLLSRIAPDGDAGVALTWRREYD